MKRIRLVKVVVPEIVAYFGNTPEIMESEYRCTECGLGIADDYVYCPYCGSEFAWDKVRKPSKRFLEFFGEL